MEAEFDKWADGKGLSAGERAEVRRVLEMGKIMTSKPIIKYLQEAVEYKLKYDEGVSHPQCKKILKMLRRLPTSQHTGYVQIPIPGDSVSLRIQVTITDRKHEIHLRNDRYLTPSLAEIDKMVDMTLSYYQTMMQDGALSDAIRHVFGDDAVRLTLNKIDRTMFIYEPFEKRLGVLCFYVDSEDRPVLPVEVPLETPSSTV